MPLGAGLVLDDHLLAERFGHFRREDAGDGGGTAGRAERNDDPHRPLREGARRIGLGERMSGRAPEQNGRDRCHESVHRGSPVGFDGGARTGIGAVNRP